jgi:hypothetical protein
MKSRRHVYQIGGAVLLLGVILASLLRIPSVVSTQSLERPAASIAQVRLVDQQYSRLAAAAVPVQMGMGDLHRLEAACAAGCPGPGMGDLHRYEALAGPSG